MGMNFGLDSSDTSTPSLPTLEQHLEAALLELQKLELARPGLPTAQARANAGQRGGAVHLLRGGEILRAVSGSAVLKRS